MIKQVVAIKTDHLMIMLLDTRLLQVEECLLCIPHVSLDGTHGTSLDLRLVLDVSYLELQPFTG